MQNKIKDFKLSDNAKNILLIMFALLLIGFGGSFQ